MINKLVIVGANGYIGQYLTQYLVNHVLELILVSRSPINCSQYKNVKNLIWNGKSLLDFKNELEATDLLINLAGKSVNCRYTNKNKTEILSSRVDSTKAIGEVLFTLSLQPKVWMNMSSATIYRHATDKPQDEYGGEIQNDFSVQICKAWEKTFNEVTLPNTRKILLRTSIVIGKNDGAFPRILNLAKYYLGGKMGNGNQMFSWIHEEDFARAINFLYSNTKAKGVFNIVCEGAITNNNLMINVRAHLKKSFGIPTPKWLLKIGAILIGTETELILKSRWVIPTKLIELGFKFKYNTINKACDNIINE